jgi:hypothetical protein
MELNNATWRKSTKSGGNGGGCIEVGAVAGVIAVRDTKDRDGAVLAFAPQAWREFATSIKNADAGSDHVQGHGAAL